MTTQHATLVHVNVRIQGQDDSYRIQNAVSEEEAIYTQYGVFTKCVAQHAVIHEYKALHSDVIFETQRFKSALEA